MVCSGCCACTASFTFLMFLNCLSWSRAQIPPGTVCRRCFLTERPWWIRVPRVLCCSFLLCAPGETPATADCSRRAEGWLRPARAPELS